MKKLTVEEFARLRKFILRDARPLDHTMWKFFFEGGSGEEFLTVISAYQNADGGFGYNIECNNWNPNSAPYTVCIAIDYLDLVPDGVYGKKKQIIDETLKYLDSGDFMTEKGWTGMQGIPSNNEYAHLPWFHYDPEKAGADVGVTKKLADFILKYAEKSSEIYIKATALKEMYAESKELLMGGVPDYDKQVEEMKSYDPATWTFYMPQPVYYVGSIDSPLYEELKDAVNKNLDYIIETLEGTKKIGISPEEELEAFERNNPHPDGKHWCVPEQAIGNYYWGTHNIVTSVDMLSKFNRLDFTLPVTLD